MLQLHAIIAPRGVCAENGPRTCLCGFSRCPACQQHASRWWRCRKSSIVVCSNGRRVRPASVLSAGNSTRSASVNVLRILFYFIVIISSRGGSGPKILKGALPHQPLHHRVHFLRSPKPEKIRISCRPTFEI